MTNCCMKNIVKFICCLYARKIVIYIIHDVIYFFVYREIIVHTVFEPKAKKTPSLLFILHKENPFSAKGLS
jgi:hypothetical protein